MARPMGETRLFDDIVVNMVDVGEETGELDKMLLKIAKNNESVVDTKVAGLMSILEPVLLIVMGRVVGFIVDRALHAAPLPAAAHQRRKMMRVRSLGTPGQGFALLRQAD